MSDDESKLRIENLPNELWTEIFNHLDWINLFLAFYGLNQRINRLLISTNVLSIYSSCLITYQHSIHLYFQEFPLINFQYLKHFRLIYDNEFDKSVNIIKELPLFSNLVSLSLEVNHGKYIDSHDLQMSIYRQRFPYLRRLQLNGNVFNFNNHELQISYIEFKSNFPSLHYLDVGTLHINYALQILGEYHELRSFSAQLYCGITTNTTTIKSFNTYLPALKILKLRGATDFGNGFGTQFLEWFLPLCLNMHTFMLKVHCYNTWEKLLQANWWSCVLVANRKLMKIALHLQWSTRINPYPWVNEITQFRSLPFFTRLNTNVRVELDNESMNRLDVSIFIEN